MIWCNGRVLPRWSRLLIPLVLACAGIVLAQGSAHAVCRCVQGGVEDQVNRADAVFSGVLVDSSGTARGKSEFATYEIEADTLYEGNVRTANVDVRSRNDDCALGALEADQRYVFFVTEQGSDLRADRCGGTAVRTPRLTRQVEQVTGEGTPLGETNQPEEPVEVEFTRVSDAEPDSLTRLAAPGAAAVLVGLLGLLVVRRVRD